MAARKPPNSKEPAGMPGSTLPTKKQLSAQIASDVEEFLRKGQIEQVDIGVSGQAAYNPKAAITAEISKDHARNQAKKTA